MEYLLSEQKLGVLALGGFVGFLLGFGLLKSGPTLKAVLTVIGAALGGAPVVFLAGTTAKWMYPVGLITGLLWVRMLGVRMQVAEKIATPSKGRTVHGWFAWMDMIVIVGVTVAVLTFSILSTDTKTIIQYGNLRLTNLGHYEVFYPLPYRSTPSLVFPSGTENPDFFRVLEQRPDGFKIEIGGAVSKGTVLEWSAQGLPADE